MLILHGIYTFKPRIIAYRNDFCLRCAAPRRAYRVRTFDVLHIFYIPLVPFGFVKRWRCATCNRDPHAHPGTRKGFKWAGIVCLAIFILAFWTMEERDAFTWAMRIGLPVGFVAALWHTIKSKPDIRLSEKLKEVAPANETICPICHRPLVNDSYWRCPQCDIERAVVKV
jgi:hypothetical protein